MKKTFLILIMIIAFAMVAVTLTVHADNTIRIVAEWNEGNQTTNTETAGTNIAIGESFTPTQDYVLTGCAFYIKGYAEAGFNGEETGYIYQKNNADNYPNNSNLIDISAPILVSSMNLTDYAWVTFAFPNNKTLYSGTTYYAVVNSTGGTKWSSGHNCTWHARDYTTPFYTGGLYTVWTGSWSAPATSSDSIFKVYGMDVDEDAPTFSDITASNTIATQPVVLSCTVTDDRDIDKVWYQWNNTGTSANQTAWDIAGITYVAEHTGTWQSSVSNVVSVRVYANDTTGNEAASSTFIFSFTAPTAVPATATPAPTTYTGAYSYLIAFIICIVPAIVGFLTVGPWGFLIGLNVGVALGITSFGSYVPVWAGLVMAVMDVAALLTSGLGGKDGMK